MIQCELVHEHKDLIDTGASATVNEETKKFKEKYPKEVESMQEGMAEALKSKDEEWQQVLSEAKLSIRRLRANNRRAQDILI